MAQEDERPQKRHPQEEPADERLAKESGVEGAEVLGQALGQRASRRDRDQERAGDEERAQSRLEEVDEGAPSGHGQRRSHGQQRTGQHEKPRHGPTRHDPPAKCDVGEGHGGEQGAPQAEQREHRVEQRHRTHRALEQARQCVAGESPGGREVNGVRCYRQGLFFRLRRARSPIWPGEAVARRRRLIGQRYTHMVMRVRRCPYPYLRLGTTPRWLRFSCVRFSVEQSIDAPRDAVEAAFLEPAFYAALGDMSAIRPPEVVERRVEGPGDNLVHRRVQYAFSGTLSGPARALLDPARLTWAYHSNLYRAE